MGEPYRHSGGQQGQQSHSQTEEAPRAALSVTPTAKPQRDKIDANKKTERAKLAELNSGNSANTEDLPPHPLSKPSLNSSLAYQVDIVKAGARRFDATVPTESVEALRFASDMSTNIPGDARIYDNLESVSVASVEGVQRAAKATAGAYINVMKSADVGDVRGVDEARAEVGVRGGGVVEAGVARGGGAGEGHRRRMRKAY
jgi:hypothetical protein